MISDLQSLLTVVAAIGSGLIAGTFFAFSGFAMRALERLPAPHGVAAMQSINVVVINPVFLSVFFGTGLVCAVLCVGAVLGWRETRPIWLIAGSLAYLLGCLLVTMARNVPMNTALARVAAACPMLTQHLMGSGCSGTRAPTAARQAGLHRVFVASRGQRSIGPIDSGIRSGCQSSTVQDVLPFQAYPRRFDLACHLGVLADMPAIGVAKFRLIGTHEDPALERGSWTPLIDAGEIIGAVLRTRAAVRPVYVSIGHRVSLETGMRFTLACTLRFRLPETTRAADRISRSS